MNVIRLVCLTLALAIIAPSSAMADQAKPKAEKAVSLTGCLTPTSQKGHQLAVMTTSATTPVVTATTVYRLIAIPPAAEVKKHENHRVTVTGWLTGPPPKPQTATAGKEPQPSTVMDVRVKDILHVADSCK